MALPLMLAGPILRRVEPTLVSVWMALSDPATIRITLWQGRVTAGTSETPWIASDPRSAADGRARNCEAIDAD
jgi:hypothetical protein